MRIAALVKQIPQFEALTLGDDGRLVRDGVELEMNAYCRRAVAKAVELAVERNGSHVTVFTLGPPSADDCLREAIAWGHQHGLDAIEGVHVCDPTFAGSDTLATAKALAAALHSAGPFDLILCGRNSVDADTGQVGPQLAELLELPFMTGVRHLAIASSGLVDVRCEHDDGWLQAELELPALLSCAERLCEPSKVEPAGRAASRPIESASSPQTSSGRGRGVPRRARRASARCGSSKRRATRSAGRPRRSNSKLQKPWRCSTDAVPSGAAHKHRQRRCRHTSRVARGPVGVIVEPERERFTRELLGAAARLANTNGDGDGDGDGDAMSVTALVVAGSDAESLGSYGADEIVTMQGAEVEEDVAAAIADWASDQQPEIILVPSTAWGREVASRVSPRLGAGLTGDAVGLDMESPDTLIAWKPAFGGQLVAAIFCSSKPQMATVRAGVLPLLAPRTAPDRGTPTLTTTITVEPRNRVRVLARTRDDDIDILADASAIIAVGKGVDPARYGDLEPLRTVLDAHFGATRKVTDMGWLPRSRQIGITGRSIAPRILVSIAASGKFNHTIGFRGAQHVLAINSDPDAPIFGCADAGIIGDWPDVVPLVVTEIRRRSG